MMPKRGGRSLDELSLLSEYRSMTLAVPNLHLRGLCAFLCSERCLERLDSGKIFTTVIKINFPRGHVV